VSFVGIAAFPSSRLPSFAFVGFWSSTCASWGSSIRDSNFVPFVVNLLINGEIEKPSGQYLGLTCDESLKCRGLNLNPGHFSSFTFILVHVENRVCLSRGVQMACVVW
jgi:hypothetical protein